VKPVDAGEQTFEAFELITGETIKVPAYEVLLEYKLPVFKHSKHMDGKYSDTCGVAAHLNSGDAIRNGFYEFVERQSLIHTWLTKRPGKRVIPEQIENRKIQQTIHDVKKYIDEIHLFNISIVDDFYVILSVGYHEECFSIGVDADPDFHKAVIGSLNEFSMILEGSILFEKETKKESFHDSQLYSEIFYNLTVEAFRSKLQFLFDSEPMDERHEPKELPFHQLLKNVRDQLQVPIYCTFIPRSVESSVEKVVKVFSPDGYPHMNTELYDPEDYPISKTVPHSGFPNKGIHIPFP
jgi:ribosomal protein S12 methylthiotransferase accessory factor YcaO